MKTSHLIASLTSIIVLAAAAPSHAGGRRCAEIARQKQAAADAVMFYGTTGVTGLMRAAATGDINVGLEALRNGDDVNARTSETNGSGAHVGGLTALMMAAGNGHEPMVRWLMERGANVKTKSANGQTALGRAVFAGESDATVSIVKALLAAGADRHADRPKNLTLEDVAQRAGHARLAAMLRNPAVAGGKR